MDVMIKYYRVCRVWCKQCGEILEHVNQTKDENTLRVMNCSCGAVGLDPSATLYRILDSRANYADLSEEWDENTQLCTTSPQDQTTIRSKRLRNFVGEECNKNNIQINRKEDRTMLCIRPP